uniref:Cytoskeleton-associated protein 2 C-terminal domain-containing protein n=1 Tax=Anolis carolinensis TaxID=28377 RepID=G1KYI9_ANOCA
MPRSSKRSPWPEVRLLTPVRRSLRIEGATASYPQMLRDHDPVVSSLEEIVAADHGSQFLFRSNAALPGVVRVADFVTVGTTPPRPRRKHHCHIEECSHSLLSSQPPPFSFFVNKTGPTALFSEALLETCPSLFFNPSISVLSKTFMAGIPGLL